MEDYKEEIRNLLSLHYRTSSKTEAPLQRTTEDILAEVRGVIPSAPITEHDIYEIMKELGFQQQRKIFYQEVCIREANKDKGIKAEYDKIETSRIFVWELYD